MIYEISDGLGRVLMYYVMSDIHGEYDRYLAMLKKINFCDDDILFVLGDVVDRGPEPVKVLWDMSLRTNVYPVLGNHELMALEILQTLLAEVTEDNYDTQITLEVLNKLTAWQYEGGGTTLKRFQELSNEDRFALMEYMEEFEPYKIIDTKDGNTFILVHGGLGNYYEGKPFGAYTLEELTFMRPKLNRIYYDKTVTVIVGHTPTMAINGKPEIYKSGNVRFIDCGAAYNGRLACLCLDTMQEYYV